LQLPIVNKIIAKPQRRHSSFITHHSSLLTHHSSLITHHSSVPRRAFSLLEVILALAIFTMAVAVLGELARMGLQNAKKAQDLTRAEMICESIMSEVVAGVLQPQSVDSTPVASLDETLDQNGDFPWLYSIETQQIDQDGLIAVVVTVQQDVPKEKRPASFSLTRWIPDPGIETSSSSTNQSTSTGGTN
jgi:type II secretion system protein I